MGTLARSLLQSMSRTGVAPSLEMVRTNMTSGFAHPTMTRQSGDKLLKLGPHMGEYQKRSAQQPSFKVSRAGSALIISNWASGSGRSLQRQLIRLPGPFAISHY